MNYVEDFRPPYFYRNKELEFKEMEVFEHQNDSQFKLIRAKNYYNYFYIQDQLKYLEGRLQHPNILTIHRCNHDSISLELYFDFIITLEDYVAQKITHEEVWNMLVQITTILTLLQEQKLRYMSIHPRGIYRIYTYKQYYVYKIADTFLIKNQVMKYFLSPILFYQNLPEHNLYKSDIFSLGLVALYCLGVKDTQIFYEATKFNFKNLEKIINQLKLPSYLERVILNMLTEDESYRPDPQQLLISLKSYTKVYKLADRELEILIYDHQPLQILNEQVVEEVSENEIQAPQPQLIQEQKTKVVTRLQGHLPYSNGYYYVGEFNPITKKREGRGIFFDNKGNKLIEGTFLNDLPEGDNITIWQYEQIVDSNHLNLSGWSKFVGGVTQGVRQGNGKLYFQNGNTFEGHFLDDVVIGSGVYHYEHDMIEGTWMQNKFVS